MQNKVDKSKKTGADGGPDSQLDEVDLLVLEVIGEESPVIRGLGISDSMGVGQMHQEPKDVDNAPDDKSLEENIPLKSTAPSCSNSYFQKPGS